VKRKDTKNKFTKTIFNLSVLFSLIFLLLLIILQKNSNFFFDLFQNNLLNSKIKEIYVLKRGKTSIDFLSGKILISNIHLKLKKNNLENLKLKYHKLIDIKIDKLEIFGISWVDLLISGQLNSSKIKIIGGEISYFYFPSEKALKILKKKTKKTGIYSDFLYLTGFKFKFYRKYSNSPLINMKNIFMKLNNLKINTSNSIPFNRFISFASPDFYASNIEIVLKRKEYLLNIGSVNLSSSERLGVITKISYSPISKFKKPNYSSLEINRMVFNNPDIFSIPETGIIKTNNISIFSPKLKIFHKRSLKTRLLKTRKFPHEILNKIKFKFDTGDINIKNGSIVYYEKNIGRKRYESIFFSNITGKITGFKNIHFHKKGNLFTTFNFSGKFMKKSSLNLTLKIPISLKTADYLFAGNLSRTDPMVFNRFLSRNARLRIDRGKIEGMNFKILANDHIAKGNMYLRYRNLKISFLKKRNYLKKRKFYSFIANTILRKNNLPESGSFKIGNIYYKKREEISFPNFLWKALLSGIKSSLKK